MATQFRLPLRPAEGQEVNATVTIVRDESQTAYYGGGIPLFVHKSEDETGQRLAAAQMIELGLATKEDVSGVFGVDRSTLYRHQIRLREEGVEGLIRERSGPKGGHRLRGELLRRGQQLLNKGKSQRDTARIIGLSENAVRNAIKQGRLKAPFPKGVGRPRVRGGSQPGERSAEDAAGPMGMATCRGVERILARVGKLEEAVPEFESSMAVAHGGTLVALPALLELGLLDVAQKAYGSLKNGFYGLRSTFLCLALMALLRIRTPEQMQFQTPGEFGILLGLDRVPEVKTIRRKLKELAEQKKAQWYSAGLAERWVKQSPEGMGLLYVDGHVRAYHGEKHKLSKTHVARRRLCMQATTDYWVNDKQAEPLFVVTGTANEKLIAAMKERILPEVRRLVGERRVTIVMDREGWSPKWFKELYENGFDVLTYRKGRYRKWLRKEFAVVCGKIEGREVEYDLAEKDVRLLPGFKVREVRRMRGDNRQTAVITTRKDLPMLEVAWRMFERWRQENFFRYMREHFALDALVDRGIEPADPERTVPNPKLTRCQKRLAKLRSRLCKLEKEYGARIFDNTEANRPTVRGFKIANGDLGQQIRDLKEKYVRLKARQRVLPRRVAVGKAFGKKPIVQLLPETKHLTDTIKMVAYRAETALVGLLGPAYARNEEEGRALVREMLRAPADIFPDEKAGLLRIRIHGLANRRSNTAVGYLCGQLNQTEIRYPGTHLQLHYEPLFDAKILALCQEA